MENPQWEDIAPYLQRERRSHDKGKLRAERIAEFLRRDQRCEYVEVVLRGTRMSGPDVGSCTQFLVYLDENWLPIPPDRFAAKQRYRLDIAVSERGPFIISFGSEWLLGREHWYALGVQKLQPRTSADAEIKAKALALAVASEFDLKYLDADWLRQFKLSPKELTEEARLSLDYSEPNALNVLFDETC